MARIVNAVKKQVGQRLSFAHGVEQKNEVFGLNGDIDCKNSFLLGNVVNIFFEQPIYHDVSKFLIMLDIQVIGQCNLFKSNLRRYYVCFVVFYASIVPSQIETRVVYYSGRKSRIVIQFGEQNHGFEKFKLSFWDMQIHEIFMPGRRERLFFNMNCIIRFHDLTVMNNEVIFIGFFVEFQHKKSVMVMIERIKGYFSRLYFDKIGERILPVLLSSAYLRAIARKYPLVAEKFRLRLNCLLYWEPGWYKTSVLKKISELFKYSLRINSLTQTSAAALRGSFNQDQFCPPEFLVSEMIFVYELAPLIDGDQDNLPLLLSALEEGEVRIALIKIPNSADAREQVEEYDARIEHRRLCYQNNCTVLAATHTLDIIPLKHRVAFLSRFVVLYIAPEDIDRDSMFSNYTTVIDESFEALISNWFQSLIDDAPEPDIDSIYNIVHNYEERTRMKDPRQVGDVVRLLIADFAFYSNSADNERIERVLAYVKGSEKYSMTTREIIAEAIYNNPTTLNELEIITGTSKANIKGHLNRLKARSFAEQYKDSRGRPRTRIVYTIDG